jgi:hypothetical protein
MAKKARVGVGTQDDVEDNMGMFLLAFGEGVDPLHVHRTVIRAIRAKFLPSIQQAMKDHPDWNKRWKAESATVLGWMEAVGCLAGQIAMEPKDRRTVVNVSDFDTALATVINEHKMNTADDIKIFGKWCM